jgi:protein TonB
MIRHELQRPQAPEQSKKLGVYLDVFEQSILIPNRPGKSWSFFASASAELVAISLAILIPLARTNHLPDFHWKSISVSAPVRPIEPPPVVLTSSAVRSGSIFPHRVFVLAPTQAAQSNRLDNAGSFSVEPLGPVGLEGSPRSGGIEIEQLTTIPTPARPPHVSVPEVAPSGPIRVGGGVQMAKLVKKVIPDYPPLAKTARVSGVVHLLGVIAKDGTIQNLQVIGGHPLLARAALEAVRQWIYQPTLLNGQPVEVIAPIDVNFTLGQ